jgi:hypothetical protein
MVNNIIAQLILSMQETIIGLFIWISTALLLI